MEAKLEKDYIVGMGDSADFAVVGGRRDLRVEASSGWENYHGQLSIWAACKTRKTCADTTHSRDFDSLPLLIVMDPPSMIYAT
jgi:hypothetical protein